MSNSPSVPWTQGQAGEGEDRPGAPVRAPPVVSHCRESGLCRRGAELSQVSASPPAAQSWPSEPSTAELEERSSICSFTYQQGLGLAQTWSSCGVSPWGRARHLGRPLRLSQASSRGLGGLRRSSGDVNRHPRGKPALKVAPSSGGVCFLLKC